MRWSRRTTTCPFDGPPWVATFSVAAVERGCWFPAHEIAQWLAKAHGLYGEATLFAAWTWWLDNAPLFYDSPTHLTPYGFASQASYWVAQIRKL